MKEKVIEFFTALGRRKVSFTPAIKIKLSPHTHPVWIDDMTQLTSGYVVTISTHDDNFKKSLDVLTDIELQSLNIRLGSMAMKAEKL